MKFRVTLLTGLFAFALAFTPAIAQSVDSLRIAIEATDDVIDPLGQFTYYGNIINYQIFNRLLEGDLGGNPYPVLAESVEASEDGLVWTAKLRDGVLFHDGTVMDAEDVKATFDWVLNPDNGFVSISRISVIDEVVIVDPLTVAFHLATPTAPFPDALTNVVIAPAAMAENPDGFKVNPVGTGPFKLKEMRRGDRVILEAFDDHFLGRPEVSELVFRLIPEASTRVAELETGGVDIILPVPSNEIARLSGTPGITVMNAVASDFRELAINNTVPPLDNVLVRQAISYAVDREALVAIVWPGTATPAVGPITPNSWGWNPDAVGYNYDPEKARELLAEAGYPDGITLEYMISNREGEDREAVILQQQMAAAGITLDIVRLEWSGMVNRLLSTDYVLSRIGVTQTPDPDSLMYIWYHSSSIGAYNFLLYSNPVIDDLLDRARAASSIDERIELYHEAQDIVLRDAPTVFLYYENRVFGVSDRVQGFQPSSNGFFAIKTAFAPPVSLR